MIKILPNNTIKLLVVNPSTPVDSLIKSIEGLPILIVFDADAKQMYIVDTGVKIE